MRRASFGRRAGWAALAMVVFATSAVFSGSCVDLDSLGSGPVDGGARADAEGGAGASDPCGHTRPPAAPSIDTSPGAILPPFDVALDKVVSDPDQVAGYDLDGLCTCDPRPGTDAGASCVGGAGGCDLAEGVDNAAGVIAKRAVGAFDEFPNRLIAAGKRTLLLRVTNYNGKANDKDVSVGALLSGGIREGKCPTSEFDPATGFYKPARCGSDLWTLAKDTVYATGTLLRPAVSGEGYVNDRRLVVTFGNPVELPFTETSSVGFFSAVLTGRLVPLGEDLQPRDPEREPTANERRLFRLEDGVLAGRVSTRELLRSVGTYVSRYGPLCNESSFLQVRSEVCGAIDVQLEPTLPPDPTVRCNAISAAFGFTALPAIGGAIVEAGAPSNPCADAGAAIFDCP